MPRNSDKSSSSSCCWNRSWSGPSHRSIRFEDGRDQQLQAQSNLVRVPMAYLALHSQGPHGKLALTVAIPIDNPTMSTFATHPPYRLTNWSRPTV